MTINKELFIRIGLIAHTAMVFAYISFYFEPLVLMLGLFSVLLSVLRLRFKIDDKFIFIDQGIWITLSFFIPQATWFFLPMLFYTALQGKVYYALPILIITLFQATYPYYLPIFYSTAILSGTLLYLWQKDNQHALLTENYLRIKLHDLEEIQVKLLSDWQESERLASLQERQRIAEILHDDLGHELTAANLALRAYNQLHDTTTPQALKLLKNTEVRLNQAVLRLRATVDQTTPNKTLGYASFKQLCDGFQACPITLHFEGGEFDVAPYIWQLLISCLKEALTNSIKHANPTIIEINLAITPSIARLSIMNDGIRKSEKKTGHGLSYMRKRLEAIQGSLTTQKDDTFQLICVIPKKE